MSSTEIRVPLITGLPIKTFGSPAIRSRHSIATLSWNVNLCSIQLTPSSVTPLLTSIHLRRSVTAVTKHQ